jgi:uncharacterized protein YdeI (BOF family)
MGRGLKLHTIILINSSITVLAFLGFAAPSNAKASGVDHLIINEVFSSPVSGEPEWIELYSPTSEEIDLDGFTIEDGTHKPVELTGKSIETSGYLVLTGGSGKDFSFGLNNGGDIIQLKYQGVLIDQISYGNWDNDGVNRENNAPAPSTGRSLTRVSGEADTGINKNDFIVADPSPGMGYSRPEYSNDIVINEVVPSPSFGSSDEFIELKNLSTKIVDISGWLLDDTDKGSSAYVIPAGTELPPGQCLAFYKSITGVALNDSGDEVRLFSPDLVLKTQVLYSGSKRDESYSRFENGWRWSLTLTPGEENILTEELMLSEEDNDKTAISISEARKKEDGEKVSVEGTITVLPGVLSNQYIYFEDNGSAIQVYCYKKCFPKFALGDRIRVFGELSSYYSERRIKITDISDIEVLSSNHDPPLPAPIKIDDIGEDDEGRLVVFSGVIESSSGSTFYVHGSGSIRVVIKESTGINKPKMRKGDRVKITGIVSQYKDYYRILPLDQDDVILVTSGTLPRAGGRLSVYVVISAAITTLCMSLYQKIQRKHIKLLPILQRGSKAVSFIF